MVIDYRDLLSKDEEDRSDNMIFYYRRHEERDYDIENNGSQEVIMKSSAALRSGDVVNQTYTPVVYTLENEMKMVKAPGIKGLFGKTLIAEVSKRHEMNRSFDILGLGYNRNELHVMNPNNRNENPSLIIGSDGMPKLRRQPQSLEDMVKLLTVDPRFISKLDVNLIKDSSVRQAIAEATSMGLKNVLEKQASLGVPYSQEEHDARENYTADVKARFQTYEKNWQDANSSSNIIEGEGGI